MFLFDLKEITDINKNIKSLKFFFICIFLKLYIIDINCLIFSTLKHIDNMNCAQCFIINTPVLDTLNFLYGEMITNCV